MKRANERRLEAFEMKALRHTVRYVYHGRQRKQIRGYCKYDLRKHYFTNRVVPVWNSLPNNVVMADNINIFKNRLDKFWSSYDYIYSELNHLIPEV